MKLKTWHGVAFISCVVWLAYYPALFAPLNSVDDVRLAHDLLNRTGFSWSDFWIPRSKTYFRPLVNSSFIVDQLLWGFEAPLLHFENVLIHWLNTLLVFRLCRSVANRMGQQGMTAPLLAALLFGLHPINSEAVIWIAGRADLLATSGVLLTLLCAMKAFDGKNFRWSVWAGLAFFAGTLAKETALFVLPGLFLFGWLDQKARGGLDFGGRVLTRSFMPALACTISVGFYILSRMSALHQTDAGVQQVAKIVAGSTTSGAGVAANGVDFSGLLNQFETVLQGIGFYTRKLLQPFPLNFGIIEVPAGYFWLGILVLLLMLVLLWRLSWDGSFILIGMSLASVALLVALGKSSWTPFAERYMYGPSAMLSLGACLPVCRWYRTLNNKTLRVLGRSVVVCLLLVCFLGILQRGFVWQDNFKLFADTVRKSPRFALAKNQLAEALWNRGERAEALEVVRNTEVPDSQVAFINQVMVLIQEEKFESARSFLLENLHKNRTQGYHTVILERLVDLLELMSSKTEDPKQKIIYDDEVVGYLNDLWHRTKKPFYLYRLGKKQLELDRISEARETFALAYSEFPEDSIYREPARKLAETLKEK